PRMKAQAVHITRKTLFRGRYDYQQELSETARAIPTMLNLEQLGNYILLKIKETMRVDKLALFVHDEDKHGYRLASSLGFNTNITETNLIEETSALTTLLKETGETIVKEELEKKSSVSSVKKEAIVKQLSSLQAELFLPLMLRGELRGLITLSAKKSQEMFTDEDLSLLATLANQVALTIEYIKAIDKISSERRYVGLGKAAMRMAHDIKNPLVPLKTFLQILPDKYPKEFAQMAKIDEEFTGSLYQSAIDGVNRINLLVERALHFSRHPLPQFTLVALDELLDNVLLQEEVSIKKAQVQLKKQYTPDAKNIAADAEQLSELFSNLISNAVDAMENTSNKELTVAIQPSGSFVTVEITDTGCGIPQDKIDGIFDPFITYKHKGSGLGLAIVKRIVEEHHGTIKVDSEPNQGTSFQIMLPKEQKKTTAEETVSEKENI
ncbi:MAG: ATP-binding protein, partial [Candidatus Omnitrophota bacterium]